MSLPATMFAAFGGLLLLCAIPGACAGIGIVFRHHQTIVLIPCGIISVVTAGLMMLLNRSADRANDSPISRGRCWLIPMPAFLTFTSIITGIIESRGFTYGGPSLSDLYVCTTLFGIAVLPFMLMEGKWPPILFVIGVWVYYCVWVVVVVWTFLYFRY